MFIYNDDHSACNTIPRSSLRSEFGGNMKDWNRDSTEDLKVKQDVYHLPFLAIIK